MVSLLAVPQSSAAADTTVLLQERRQRQGCVPSVRHLRSRHQPHSSPSLSWNGRYLALLITQRGRPPGLAVIDRSG